MKIFKRCDNYKAVLYWYKRAHPSVSPPRLMQADTLTTYCDGPGIMYDFVEGRIPDWRDLRTVLHSFVWAYHGPMNKEHLPTLDANKYVCYVQSRVPDEVRSVVNLRQVYMTILCANLTPTNMCHGDATLKNAVQQSNGDIILLDPGRTHDLDCEEIDDAKIMQSLDGFDVVYRGHPMPKQWPKMGIDKVHWALLVTHYVRLLSHVKHEQALAFARRRIKEITAWIS